MGRAARSTPDKVALVVYTEADDIGPTEAWTYAHLEDAILRIAGGLTAAGLAQGDRILIRLGNTSAYPLVFFGAIAGGFVPIPASAQLTEPEAAFLLRDSQARAVATDTPGAFADTDGVMVFSVEAMAHMRDRAPAMPYADTAADDAAFLVYTSGTSGRPKGVLHAQRSASGRRPMVEGWHGIGPEDRLLHAGAFNWTFTLGVGLTDPWANGATAIVYTGDRDPIVWPHLIRASQATIFAAVPGLMRQILKYSAAPRETFASLRHGLIAGEAPPSGLFDAWRERTGTELYEAFGMSEVSTFISSSPTVPRKPGTSGKVQAGRRVAILAVEGGNEPLPAGAEGLLAVHRSDPGLMLGYWGQASATTEVFRGDWFVGGDLARMDREGYVTYLGRADDMMNAMGYRVAPQEVEAVLARHPEVAEVACAEVRVREDVSVIGACIVLRAEAGVDSDGLIAFAAESLAAYKCPRRIAFAAHLPRTANGKVKRRELGQFFAKG